MAPPQAATPAAPSRHMAKTGPGEFSALLLGLYRLSQEASMAEFPDAALEVMKPALPFDSSMWGTATWGSRGMDVHSIHLHRQPVEMLQTYEEVKHLDTAALAVTRRPVSTLAFDAHSWFSGPRFRAIRAYGDRFEQRHFFISSHVDTRTGLTQWITLFRQDGGAHCSESERQLLELLAPHAMQALAHNRARQLEQMQREEVQRAHPSQGCKHAAITDLHGVLYHATPGFGPAMDAEWHGWSGTRLPGPLLQQFQGRSLRFLGRSLLALGRVEKDLLFVTVRPRCRADDLTERERSIALLVQQGLSHKEIARQLGRSPATVRNQLQAIYQKLQVGSIAGLIAEMRLAE